MTDPKHATPTRDHDEAAPAPPAPVGRLAGVLRPTHRLPSSRAVVGGLLVAVALIGTWWAASGGRAVSGDRYLVAARRLGPGEEVERSDLAWVTADLPDRLRAGAFADPASVLGRITTGPLAPGDLIQASSIVRSPGEPGSRELSFVVDTDWAVDGSLRAGDRIDLLVTYGDGASSQTRRVLADAVVRRVSDPGGDSLGSTRTQSITVALDDDDLVARATNAARAGTVTVVRSTGARRTVDPGTDTSPPKTTRSTTTTPAAETVPSGAPEGVDP